MLVNGEQEMTILDGRVPKVALRAGLALLHRAVRSRGDMRADLERSPHRHTRVVHSILVEIAGQVRNRWQSLAILEVGEFLLWIADKDTAYQDQFVAFLHRIRTAPDLVLEPKPPEAWFINLVVDEPGWTKA